MEHSSKFVIAGLVLFLVIVGVIAYSVSNGGKGVPGGNDLSQISGAGQGGNVNRYTDLNGEYVNLSDYEGNILVINAWASWCPFCVEELPDFERLGEEYGDEIVVIAINRKESLPTAQAFVEHVGSPKHILFLMDEEDKFYKSIGGFSMPETVFYDRAGNVAFHKRGFMALPEMRTHVEKAMSSGVNN